MGLEPRGRLAGERNLGGSHVEVAVEVRSVEDIAWERVEGEKGQVWDGLGELPVWGRLRQRDRRKTQRVGWHGSNWKCWSTGSGVSERSDEIR